MNSEIFKRHWAVVFATAILGLAPGLAAAQTQQDALEVLRGDLRADRKAVIAEAMKLTDKESEAFWPIYTRYRAELEPVADGVVKLVLEYRDLYPDVPEEKADQLLKDYTKAEANLLKIKTKYLKELGKVLPASKVFRFAQLDNRFDLAIRVGLAAAIPLLPAAQARPTAEQH